MEGQALTELNLAVLHSFDEAGVTITDHHTESERFLGPSSGKSALAGRARPTGPGSSRRPRRSATPVFHRYYQDFDQTPNFYRHVR